MFHRLLNLSRPKTDRHIRENFPSNFENCIHPFQSLVQITLPILSLSWSWLKLKIDSSSAANITDLSLDEILGAIFQLGDLYDSEFMMQSTYQIDQLLTIFYNGSYSITELMKRVSPITRTTNITLTQFLFRYNSPPQTFQLTPQCSSMLSKCRFHDEERNCSELFAFRKTQDGFCCTFNYATKGDDTHLWVQLNLFTHLFIYFSFIMWKGKYYSRAIQRNFLFFFYYGTFYCSTSRENGTDHRLEPIKVENLTESGGLSVLLESSLDDYFYPIFPSAEWKVIFHQAAAEFSIPITVCVHPHL